MSLVSLSLVVLAAFIHATWNLLSKRAADAGPTFVFAYNLFACLTILPRHQHRHLWQAEQAWQALQKGGG